jgi:hypothetical protein
MSNSQYKDFMSCEAKAMAKLNGWNEPTSDALLIGSYVHAALEGALDEFKTEHPEIFKNNGGMYAEFVKADELIRVLRSDPFIMFALQGKKEIIMTAEFAGAHWKIKIDSHNPEKGRFADIKTVKSIRDKYWDSEKGYVSFIESYKYDAQMAIYAEIEKRWSSRDSWLKPLIVAVSKEDVPDKEVIGFDDNDIERELETVSSNMPHILAVKNGHEDPSRCEKCRYCRQSKKLNGIIHYLDLVV